MLTDIVQEWSQYAYNMGSKIYLQENFVICVNEKTELSCNFSNCVITTQENYVKAQKYDQFFKGREYALYQLGETEQNKQFTNNWKQGTIMLLDLNQIEIRNVNEECPRNKELSSCKYATLNEEEMGKFRDVVFNAFSYDIKFSQPSEEIYRVGLKSGGVRFYGLKTNGDLKSVALVHFDQKKGFGGMELVSTRIDSQKKGYARLLLNHIFASERSLEL